jgi:ABC-type Fe3+-siderophore transport system permease subunit
MKNNNVWSDRILGISVGVVTLAVASITDRAGMPQKWHAAILGALVPFAAIVSIKRTSWPRPTLWTTLGACLAASLLLISTFFQFALSDVTTFGWIWWVPVAFIETVVILHFQPKLERKLRAR